jgi:membrane-bound ClpP family serine protease
MTLLAQAAQPAVTPDNDVYVIYAVLLLGAAVILLLVEFFVPSGGLIGILCGIAAIGSVFAFYKYDPLVACWSACSSSGCILPWPG